MSGCRMEGSSKRIGRCLALVTLLAALLASSLAHAQQQQQLPVTEIAPGLFVHIGVIALMTRENEGAIANVGFVVGNDAGVLPAQVQARPDRLVERVAVPQPIEVLMVWQAAPTVG